MCAKPLKPRLYYVTSFLCNTKPVHNARILSVRKVKICDKQKSRLKLRYNIYSLHFFFFIIFFLFSFTLLINNYCLTTNAHLHDEQYNYIVFMCL